MKLEEQIINVIFDAGKGTSPVQSREAICGKAMGEMPTPVRSGYSFAGWYNGDTRITSDTVLQSEEDIRLVAHWEKAAGTKRNSVIKKQRIAIAVLAVLIVALAVSLVLINHLISVTTFEDVYYNESGETATEKYYVKQVKGVYGIYDEDDVRMTVNEDGYHIVHSGNQYRIDEETGECVLYALVDSYDVSVGELLGHNARVLMFPQISQSDIFSIVVKNRNETFTVTRHANGTAYLKGTEDRLNVLDDNAFASLAVACGYTLTLEKLDLSSSEVPRTPDGDVDYSAYGLADSDEPIVYTVTKRAYTEDGKSCAATGDGSSYTVIVGNATVVGSGYYAKMEDRDAVYILSPSVEATLIQPSESMVTPNAIYPMSVSTYLMVEDFLLESGNISASNAYGFFQGGGFNAVNKTHIVDFDYWEFLEREYSMFELHPFTTNTDMMEGYFLDSNNISNAMALLHLMDVASCVKNGITEEAVREYILGGENRGDVHHLSFRYNLLEVESYLVRFDYESEEAFNERLLAKAKEILGQYSSASMDELKLSDALEMLETMGYYLENGILYDKATHLTNVYTLCGGVLTDLGYTYEALSDADAINIERLQAKVNTILKKLEATDAGIHYDANDLSVYVVNELLISPKTDGKYYIAVSLYDMIVEVEEHHLAFLDWNAKNWYSQYFTWLEIAFITDLEIVTGSGEKFDFRFDNSQSNSNMTDGPSTANMKIYLDRGDGEKQLVKNNVKTYITDTGLTKNETVTALDNFRQYYQYLQYISLDGLMDEDEMELMASADFTGDGVADGLTPEDCMDLPDSACDLIIYYRGVDLQGNSIAKVIRFYTYSRHSFVTVEVVDAFDEDGEATDDWRAQTNPEKAEGLFYASSAYLQKFVEYTKLVADEKIVP